MLTENELLRRATPFSQCLLNEGCFQCQRYSVSEFMYRIYSPFIVTMKTRCANWFNVGYGEIDCVAERYKNVVFQEIQSTCCINFTSLMLFWVKQLSELQENQHKSWADFLKLDIFYRVSYANSVKRKLSLCETTKMFLVEFLKHISYM